MPLAGGASSDFEVTSVIPHSGLLGSGGHYYSYIKMPNGKWHKYNNGNFVSELEGDASKRELEAAPVNYRLLFTKVA